MKFSKFYDEHRIYEWKQLYINYPLLKSMIQPFQVIIEITGQPMDRLIGYNQQSRRLSTKIDIPKELEFRLVRIEQKFVNFMQSEMDKSNQFFKLNLQKIDIKLQKLRYNLVVMLEKQFRKTQSQKEKEENNSNFYVLKQSTQTLFRECFLIESFSNLNRQATKKLIKNYQEKVFFLDNTTKNCLNFFKHQQSLDMFNDSNKLGQIKEDIEYLYITYYCRDNPKKGVQTLKLEGKERILTNNYSFIFGLYFGFANFILLGIILNRIEIFINFSQYQDDLFPMFRGLGLFLIFSWLLATSVYIWNRCHVNYKKCFQFNYHHSTIYQILGQISFFTIIYLLVFLGCLEKEIFQYAKEGDQIDYNPMLVLVVFPYELGPLIIWSSIILYLIIPTTKKFNALGRRYFLRNIGLVLISPFGPISFTTTWLTEQLISLIIPISDLFYTIFYYIEFFKNDKFTFREQNSLYCYFIITIIILTLRMSQNIRMAIQSGNILQSQFLIKFIIDILTILTTITAYLSNFYQFLFYFWIILGIITALGSYAWDIIIEFDLLKHDSKYKRLRKELAINKPRYYYAAMIINLVLKINFILTISPNLSQLITIRNDLILLLIGLLEIFRSFFIYVYSGFIWNLITLEKEHLVVVGQFKQVTEMIFPYENKLKKDPQAGSLTRESYKAIQIYSPNNDIQYRAKMEQLSDLEQTLLSSHQYEDSNEEEIYLNNLGSFQNKVDRLYRDYPEKLAQIARDVKDIQNYIQSLLVSENENDKQLNQPLIV